MEFGKIGKILTLIPVLIITSGGVSAPWGRGLPFMASLLISSFFLGLTILIAKEIID